MSLAALIFTERCEQMLPPKRAPLRVPATAPNPLLITTVVAFLLAFMGGLWALFIVDLTVGVGIR